MDAQTLTLFVVKATVVLLVGGLVAAALRRAPAGARHLVWLATVAGVLVLPLTTRWTPLRLEILPHALQSEPAVRQARMMAAAPVNEPPEQNLATPPRFAPAPKASSAHAEPARGGSATWPAVQPMLLALWLGVAMGLFVRLLAGVLAVRRIVRSARPLDDPRWAALLCEVADRLDLETLPRLVASDRVEMPFACGASRSTIVLPTNALDWTEDRRRVVLLHELGHVRRRDLVGDTLSRIACALYWFHPLVWTAARRLRAEGERACDDLVLTCGARASDYASHLLEILSAARPQGAPAPALPMARRKEFEGRLLAILDPAARRTAPGPAQSAVLIASLGLIFLAVGAMAPSPSAPDTPAEPSASVEAEPQSTTAPAASPAPRPRERRAARDADQQEGANDRRDDRRATLIRVLRTDPDATVRRSAAWALSRGNQADALDALVATLRGDEDGEVREMAAWALADVRGDAASTALAVALRGDASDEVRATAAWALGQRRLSDPAVLLGAITDRATDVRRTAIWGLGHQRLEKAPAPLVAALRDSDADVRVVAAWALGEILDPATAPALRAAFNEDKNEEVRRALFRALAFLGDRSSDVLERALEDKDPEIRAHAVRMMAGGGPGVWPWPWPWPQPRPMP